MWVHAEFTGYGGIIATARAQREIGLCREGILRVDVGESIVWEKYRVKGELSTREEDNIRWEEMN
jgi:hypothetical protein